MAQLKVHKSKIPKKSEFAGFSNLNYTDSFVCEVSPKLSIEPDDIIIDFWESMPRWIDLLFKLRNFLVKPLGLRTGKWEQSSFGVAIRSNAQYQLMSVVKKTKHETIILLDDEHLAAYLSAYVSKESDSKYVYLITGVNYHNNLGRVYFFCIRPFHSVIMKQLLKHSVGKYFL